MYGSVFRGSLAVLCYFVLPVISCLLPREKHGTLSSEPNDLSLAGRDNRCAGQLRMKHEAEWRPLSYRHSWSLKEASVACRQLNCGSAVSSNKNNYKGKLLATWRFYSDCDGSERALMDCGTVKKSFSSSTIEILCSAVLPKPTITLYSGRSNDQDEEDNAVLKGYSFTMRCCVEPYYPSYSGHFSLIFTGLRQNYTWTQAAFNFSARFRFLVADKKHQGNYSCVYRNVVFNHNVSSESESLSLTVRDFSDVSLDDGVVRDDDSYVVCAGQLLVNSENDTKPVSAQSAVWDLKHAAVVCRQLGCGSAISTTAHILPNATSVWRFFSDCDGSESALLDCGTVTPWISSSIVKVNCTGNK